MAKKKLTQINKFVNNNKVRMTVLAILAISLLSAAIIYGRLSQQVSTVSEIASQPGICQVNFELNTPAPSPLPSPSLLPSASPSPVPSPSISPAVCDISFDLPDSKYCSKTATSIPITYTVHSLPPGGPYYIVTDWFKAAPDEGEHHYFFDEQHPLEAGKTYTMYADWPGIATGFKGTVEVHAGLQVVPNRFELLEPNCTGAIDFYRTPYVPCP